MTQPTLYMIAGPNGAGKTTTAMKLLPDFLSVYEFVNADEIARGLNPLNPEGQALAAGRIMIERINKLIADKKNFAFETTGASRSFVDIIERAIKAGFEFRLIFVWLPSSDLSKSRVRLRVSQGGHNIPPEDIERRYSRALRNLIDLYLPLTKHAEIYDNSNLPKIDVPTLIAEKSNDILKISNPDIWYDIEQVAEGSTI